MNKQEHVVTVDVGGTPLTLKTGWMAKQANGAVTCQYGDTVVFTAVVSDLKGREGLDFFPLTVDYREKTYAAGKIPGGFFKREARPSEKEILTCRLIDRPIRPCFPEGYKNETQVQAMVWSHDQEHDPDTIAIVASTAALAVSDVPFSKTLAGVRVGRDDAGFVVNPTYEELAESDIDLVLVGDRDGIVMVEGSALEVSEEDMLEALSFGHENIKIIIGAIEELVSLAGKEKRPSPELPDHSELLAKVAGIAEAKIKSAYADSNDKHELYAAIDATKEEVVSTLCPEGDENAPDAGLVKGLFKDLESSILRKNVTQDNVRADGRTTTDIRPIDITVNNLPGTHGDALFTRGETQALVAATLGTGQDEQLMDVLEGEYKKKFYLHYNFPPFSVGETRRIMGPGRREIGHGMLAERALRAVLPDLESFPYTIRIVSEILESNGSSSMASVCGGSLAMMDAGVPILAPVAGIAMGLIKEGDDFAILSDILGVEDHLGDMDFKVTGTENGITAFQLDLKIQGITKDIMAQALAQAKDGRLHILAKMAETLAEPRPEVSPNAPKITQLTINREKIRDLIGPGGKVIRGIVEMTGAQIDVDDEGTVTIAAIDSESADQAIDMIRSITVDPEVGQQYTGRVTRLMRFGAFVEIMPGKEGMIHISDAADGHVDRIEDVFDVGDPVEVVVKEIDQQGRVNLHVFGVEPSPSGGGRDRGGRGGRDDRGGRGGRGGGRDRGGRGGRDDRGGRGGRDRGGRDDRGGRGGRDRDDRGGRGGRDRDDSDRGSRRPRRSRDDDDNGGGRPRGGRDRDDDRGGRGGRDRDDRGGRGRGRGRDDDGGGRGRGRGRDDDEGGRGPARQDRPRKRDNDDDGDRPPRRDAGNSGNMDWYDRESRWDREERK